MKDSFLQQFKIIRNEYLLKTEELFIANRHKWFADFAEHFQSACATVARLQNESTLPAISFMEYTMLYTNFINRNYVAEIWVYNGRSYLDKGQRVIGEYDISFLFVYYDELWDKLISERKRYAGNVTASEITTLMIEALPSFYSFFINIARFAIMELVTSGLLANIKKNELFRVTVGNYMEKTEPIYTENKNKDAVKLAQWFSKRINDEFSFGDYSDLDFSGKTFQYADFRYAQFRGSILKNTVFYNSSLIGVNFRNAYMDGCNLNYSSIFEADFSNAKLKNASFIKAEAKVGLSDYKNWKFVGFLPVCFRNADLTGANFHGADLTGANFAGADLSYADFTGATIIDADFSGAVLNGTIL